MKKLVVLMIVILSLALVGCVPVEYKHSIKGQGEILHNTDTKSSSFSSKATAAFLESGETSQDQDSTTFPSGTKMSLKAEAEKGWFFSHWEGDIKGSQNPVTVVMEGPLMQVNAVFKSLVNACEEEDIETVKKAIKAGVDVNWAPEGDEAAPLYIAIDRNNIKLIETLIKGGADVNRRVYKGKTPLIHAIQTNNELAIIETLLEYGANTRLKDRYGNTAFDYATEGTKIYKMLEAETEDK